MTQEDELRLMATAFETGQATLITNAGMRIERVNQAFTNITGYTADEVMGQTPKMFKSGLHGPDFYAALWEVLKKRGHWQGEIWNRNKHGDIYPVWQSITAVAGDDGEVRHYVSVFHDIAERKRIEQKLAHEATRDHLTGAANRRAFDRALVKATRTANRQGGDIALVLFDIDHFKAVNDNHGHDTGDNILTALTRCVQHRLRKSDMLARWGGEEFALLLPDTPVEGARQLAERLRADVAQAALPGPSVTISLGLTGFQPGDSARNLIMRADRALYRAKQSGRNRVELLVEDAAPERDEAGDDKAQPVSATSGAKPSNRSATEAGAEPRGEGEQALDSAAQPVAERSSAGWPRHPRYIDEHHGTLRRSQLTRRLEEALARAARRGGGVTVCALDVDHFKAINERLGHARADRLMLMLARRLNQQLGSDDLIVRTGGDEFTLLMHEAGAGAALERLLDVIAKPFTLGGRSVAITASLGAACYPEDHGEADVLLRHAQQAMYRAKQNGRNALSRFDPGQDRHVQRRQRQRRRFEQAIRDNELQLHYQPQVDLATGQVVGLEALVRWQHPEKGLLAPAEFLPLIDGTWLECALGEWVLKAALYQLGCWGRGCDLPVSVNISPSHLLSSDFIAQLTGLLATMPALSPSRLKIEVVETAAMQDTAAALEVIRRCQALGVEVAIDDFGTGFSSLTHLRQLPVDLIKVDKSFVRDMLEDNSDRAIVESVIYMARRFDRDLLAEGVESLEHAAELLGLGCRLAQGYGIARPMSAAALTAWLEEWPRRREWQGLHARQKPLVTELT